MHDTIVIFSHWFGVRKHSGWLFTDIADALQILSIESVLFNYNEYNEETRELFALPFSAQAKILQEIINTTVREHPDKRIIIIWHSQGCIIPCLCDLSSVHALVMLSPFFHTEIKSVIERYTKDPANTFSLTNQSTRKRSDGSTTIIPPEYWRERFDTDITKLYNETATKKNMYIISPLQDEIMDFNEYKKLKNLFILNLDGDHNFSQQRRQPVIGRIKYIIQSVWFLSYRRK